MFEIVVRVTAVLEGGGAAPASVLSAISLAFVAACFSVSKQQRPLTFPNVSCAPGCVVKLTHSSQQLRNAHTRIIPILLRKELGFRNEGASQGHPTSDQKNNIDQRSLGPRTLGFLSDLTCLLAETHAIV